MSSENIETLNDYFHLSVNACEAMSRHVKIYWAVVNDSWEAPARFYIVSVNFLGKIYTLAKGS